MWWVPHHQPPPPQHHRQQREGGQGSSGVIQLPGRTQGHPTPCQDFAVFCSSASVPCGHSLAPRLGLVSGAPSLCLLCHPQILPCVSELGSHCVTSCKPGAQPAQTALESWLRKRLRVPDHWVMDLALSHVLLSFHVSFSSCFSKLDSDWKAERVQQFIWWMWFLLLPGASQFSNCLCLLQMLSSMAWGS